MKGLIRGFAKKKRLMWIIVFAVSASLVLTATNAIGNFGTRTEAEDGTLFGNAQIVQDDSSSNGSHVQFGNTYPQIGVSEYMPGVTLTQDTSGYSSSLKTSSTLVNQHFYSFGAAGSDNDWYALGRRMNIVLADYSSGVVLTACCSTPALAQDPAKELTKTPIKWVDDPDGTEDYNQATADRQAYYQQYADLIAQAVSRYPKIQYVQVWNEMKGYFESDFLAVPGHAGGDNYKKYTIFYNTVYDAVKSARSSVKVGGPYVVMHSMSKDRPWAMSNISGQNWGYIDARDVASVRYWWSHKQGADFIALDIKNHNVCEDPNTLDCDPEDSNNPFARMDKYQAVVDWLKKASSDGGLDIGSLPIIWSEWYARHNPIIQDRRPDDPDLSNPNNLAYQGTVDMRNALMSAGLIKVVKSGVLSALVWGAQGLGNDGIYHPLALYNETKTGNTKFYATQKCINDYFTVGAKLYDTRNTNSNIESLGTIASTGDKTMLIVNKTGSQQTGEFFNSSQQLNAYEVRCLTL